MRTNSPVVPAKAGTHNHKRQPIRAGSGYGSRLSLTLGRDDGDK